MESSPSPSPATAKLRLMCSYGGHIIPRPLDKSLCYAGGETRIVAVPRTTALSLSSLTSHVSKSLLNGRPFSFKYQLPNHDLDSLVSISTDEDLANMIDEYDRLAAPSRLRFFLFPEEEEEEGGMERTRTRTSEEWFVDALRNVGVVASKDRSDDSESEGKVPVNGGLLNSGTSLPESIVLEKNSSFGSTSSSFSASNSPAIRSGEDGVGVRVQDFKAAIPLVDSIGSESSLASQIFSPQGIVYQDASGFNESKVVSANLLETESNVSDCSPRGDLLTPVQVSSGYVLSKPMDQQPRQAPAPQPSATPQPLPQQYIHPAPQAHYVTTQYYPSPMQVPSYPAMYPPYIQTHQPVQYHQINTQYGYPVYMVPVGQAQNVGQGHPQMPSNPVMVTSPPVYYDGYSGGAHPQAADYATKVYRTSAVPTQAVNMPSDDHPSLSRPQTPPNPTMVAPSPVVYDGHNPAANVYRMSDDHHQIVAFPPVSEPSQPIDSAPLENKSYISEYEDPMHAQIYRTQPPAPTLPSQLQTATNAASVMLSETLAQLHVDNANH